VCSSAGTRSEVIENADAQDKTAFGSRERGERGEERRGEERERETAIAEAPRQEEMI
jgi:hypothetical protein